MLEWPRSPTVEAMSTAEIVSLGSHVLLDDLDEGTCEAYMLVSPADSKPAEGKISNESPVGRAIEGHCDGEVVAALAPHGVRHLRITTVSS
jgi:transcription elongation factor GreA